MTKSPPSKKPATPAPTENILQRMSARQSKHRLDVESQRARYKTLVLRTDLAEPGDCSELESLIVQLGLADSDLTSDIAEARTVASETAKAEKFNEQREAMNAEVQRALADVKAAEEKLKAARTLANDLGLQFNSKGHWVSTARGKAHKARLNAPRIFGDWGAKPGVTIPAPIPPGLTAQVNAPFPMAEARGKDPLAPMPNAPIFEGVEKRKQLAHGDKPLPAGPAHVGPIDRYPGQKPPAQK